MAAFCALVFALLVDAAPMAGGDLTAQEWWASWASSSGAPVDLGRYGGVPVASYSPLSPWVGALFGLPLAGVLGTVLGAASTTALLGRQCTLVSSDRSRMVVEVTAPGRIELAAWAVPVVVARRAGRLRATGFARRSDHARRRPARASCADQLLAAGGRCD